jgi:uncharacterized protein YchJ
LSNNIIKYEELLQALMARFSFLVRKNIVYFTDRWNPDVCFAMYADEEILAKTKKIKEGKKSAIV